MMELLKAVVMGVVQGLTEFLPVSSTGHLLIASNLLQFREAEALGGTFEIFIQFGTVLALLAFYGKDLLAQARGVASDALTRRFWLSIVIAFIPAAVLGLLLRGFIKTVLYGSPTIIAWSLIIGGIVLMVVDRLPRRNVERVERRHERGDADVVREVRPIQALVVGLAQAVALIPGVSRSGASIVGGLLAGLDRSTATRFSFYLAIPTLGAATLADLVGSLKLITSDVLVLLLLGTVVSGIVGGLSIRWLLGYVANHTFVPFGIYRIVVGVLILALTATNILKTTTPVGG